MGSNIPFAAPAHFLNLWRFGFFPGTLFPVGPELLCMVGTLFHATEAFPKRSRHILAPLGPSSSVRRNPALFSTVLLLVNRLSAGFEWQRRDPPDDSNQLALYFRLRRQISRSSR